MPVTAQFLVSGRMGDTPVVDSDQKLTLPWKILLLVTLAKLLGFIKVGTGTPQATVTAPIGTIFLRLDGGANTTLYVKESGIGNTGWVGK